MEAVNFQEQLEIDLESVFFNKAAMEFVTPHMIGGIRGKTAVKCNVVVDHELYKERILKTDSVENISLNGLIFFIKKENWINDFKHIPKVGSALMFDDERYNVDSVSDDMGVLEITLEAARG